MNENLDNNSDNELDKSKMFDDKEDIFVIDNSVNDDELDINNDTVNESSIENIDDSRIIEVDFVNSKVNSNNDIKNKIVDLIINKKFLFVIITLSFVFVCVTVGKVYYLRGVVDNYEEVFLTIEEKESTDTIVYNDKDSLDEGLKRSVLHETYRQN